jgi:hypothetical protein
MPRTAIGLVAAGLLAILLAVVIVMGDATLPGGVPPAAVAVLAALGGAALVFGLWLVDPRDRDRQSFSG